MKGIKKAAVAHGRRLNLAIVGVVFDAAPDHFFSGLPVEFVTKETEERMFSTHYHSIAATAKAFIPLLRDSDGGRFIFMGNIQSHIVRPFSHPYTATRFAVRALADALRRELQTVGIAVSRVEPGFVQSTPLAEDSTRARDIGVYRQHYDRELLTGEAMSKTRATTTATDRDILHALTAPRPKPVYHPGSLLNLPARVVIAVFNSLDASVQDLVLAARSGNSSLWNSITQIIPTWGLIAIASFASWVSIDSTFGTSTFFTDELSGLLHSVVCSVLVGATALSDLSTGRDIFCFCSCPLEPPWTATAISSVSLGYGFYDAAVGLFRLKRWDYSLHGLVLICSCGAVCYSHQGHHVAYAMFMEWSTVFLNIRVLNSVFVDFTFVLLFFVMRIGVVPIIWTKWMLVFFREGSTEATSCIPAVVPYAALFGGIILHSLNCFWGRLVLLKFLRVFRNRNQERPRQRQQQHKRKDKDRAATMAATTKKVD